MGLEIDPTIDQITVVLDNLKCADGNRAGLAECIAIGNQEINFICGEPGTGKTTLLEQLKKRLQKNGFTVYQVYYDQTKDRTLEEINLDRKEYEKFKSSAELTEEGKQHLNRNLIQDIEAVEQKVAEDKRIAQARGEEFRPIILVELPGLIGGFGYGAIEHFVRKYGDKAGVTANATDLALQTRSLGIRQVVAMKMSKDKPVSDPDPVLGIIPYLNTNNIWVVGLQGLPDLEQNLIVGRVMSRAAKAGTVLAFSGFAVEDQKRLSETSSLVEGRPNFFEARDEILKQVVKHGTWGCRYKTEEAAREAIRISDSNLCYVLDSAASYRIQVDRLKDNGLKEENIRLIANMLDTVNPIWWVISR